MGSSERSPGWRMPAPREPGAPLPTGAGSGCRWSAFTTRSPDQAHAFLTSSVYEGQEIHVGGDPRSFEFTVYSRQLGLFRIDVLEHTGSLAMAGVTTDHVLAVEVLAGELVVEAREGRLSVSAGEAVLMTVDEPWEVSWRDLHAVVVRFDAFEFRRLAAELADVDTAGRTLHVGKGSPSQVRQWSAAVRYVVEGVFQTPEAVRSPVAQRESFRLLAATALEVFPQPEFSLDRRSHAAATSSLPTTVRRAIGFIEAHAAEEITVVDIARGAGLSPRGLQAAFRRHLDVSPAAYLRSVRLQHVHRELEQTDARSGRSVAQIAARWGFLHPGRFAAAYRERFGVPPSHTLLH